MRTPKSFEEMEKLHLEDHAIVLEMLHTLANHLGKYFQPTGDGSYTPLDKDK